MHLMDNENNIDIKNISSGTCGSDLCMYTHKTILQGRRILFILFIFFMTMEEKKCSIQSVDYTICIADINVKTH